MTEAITATRGLFVNIPLRVRQALYGLFGLIVVLDGIWNLIPDGTDVKVVATFGVFNSIMALANSTASTPLPPPPNGGVEPNFPDEFA